MKWKQFFTPVASINSDEAKKMTADYSDDVVLLDVRQPGEYKRSHIPGAKLIPIKELESRLHELDPDKPTIVY